jgi:hypothetical protein
MDCSLDGPIQHAPARDHNWWNGLTECSRTRPREVFLCKLPMRIVPTWIPLRPLYLMQVTPRRDNPSAHAVTAALGTCFTSNDR